LIPVIKLRAPEGFGFQQVIKLLIEVPVHFFGEIVP